MAINTMEILDSSLFRLPVSNRLRRIPVTTCAARTPITTSIIEQNIRTGGVRSLNAALLDGDDRQTIEGGGLPASTQPVDLASVGRSFFLPAGWPDKVTQDYINYQLWTFPAHVTGWMSHSLAGSSMLKALGVGAGPGAAVGYAAAIKWVTKDGIGAAGRLFVGSRLSTVFDEDPRRWRMIAEAITTVGLALEIATQISPSNFIALAGAGTLAKATGKGMGRPAFRVVQNHFAAGNNVGDVAAKEEVWEVTAQMVGLALSVGLLSILETVGVPEAVIPLWVGIHGSHVFLRYNALKQLRFPYPNFKRAAMLVASHMSDGSIMTVDEVNRNEPMLAALENDPGYLKCVLGCSIDDLLSRIPVENDLADLMGLYDRERYLLIRREGVAYVALWERADSIDILQAMWQAAWLEKRSVSGHGLSSDNETIEAHRESVSACRREFPAFTEAAEKLGWELHRGVFPTDSFRLRNQSP